MKTNSILIIFLTLGLCAGTATAKGAGKKGAGHVGKLDANGDGMVSLAEFTDKAKKRFESADANHDGQLDQTELGSLKKKRGDNGGGKKHKGNK